VNWRERTLLALTIVGFVVPNTMIALFAVRHGLSFDGYLRHWGESLPATQLALDVGIAFLAFALWAAWEGQRLGMRSWWVPVPASLLVGLCFALPLFLLLRERAVRKRPTPRQTDRREPNLPKATP
jgi:putative Ca2+/H+ antiporter (TMEM165/GDT1 family)